MSERITIPGTDTNVTPEIEAPTMPKATIYHGDFLFPRKKVSLSAFLFVSLLNRKRAAKYISIVSNIIMIGQSFTF